MPTPEETTDAEEAAAVGEIDVRALFEQLRRELRTFGSAAPGPEGGAARRAEARSLAERYWPVSAERPVQGNAFSVAVKKAIRKLVRWYVEPFAYEQRLFNDSALKLLDELSEELDRQDGRLAGLERAERLARELEERLVRLERRERGAGVAPVAATVAAQPAASAIPDYFRFETRMRGRADEIRERQRAYVDLFRDAAPVVDLGCGRGEFLGLLREAGVEARGADGDADMVAFARGDGLEVEQADVVAYLGGLADGSLGGVFAAQLVEHLPPPALVAVLELAVRKLRPGGLLVAETINPLSPLALRNYYADLTHAQPLVPETLALLAEQAGFASVETRFLNVPPAAERLAPVALADPAASAALAANVARLNELLFGPLDYAIVARR